MADTKSRSNKSDNTQLAATAQVTHWQLLQVVVRSDFVSPGSLPNGIDASMTRGLARFVTSWYTTSAVEPERGALVTLCTHPTT
jgi:hypothetical protein